MDGSYTCLRAHADCRAIIFPGENHFGASVFKAPRPDPLRRTDSLPQNPTSQGEAILQAVADSLPGCACYIDRDLRYRFANDRYREWFGSTGEDVVGKTVREFLGPEIFQLRLPFLERVLAGETVRFEGPTPLGDGRVLETEIQYTPDVRDGVVQGFVAMVNDVTDRRTAEQALLDREERLATQKEAHDLAVSSAPADQVLYYLARAAQRQCDADAGAAIMVVDSDGQRLHPRASAGLPDGFAEAVVGLKAGPLPHSDQTLIFQDAHDDPHWQPYLPLFQRYGIRAGWSHPILSSSHEVVGIFAIYHQVPRKPRRKELEVLRLLAQTASIIIERDRTIHALRERERQFQTLADSMPQLVWTAEPDGTVDYYNARVHEYEGFSFDAEAGRWVWRACLHPDDVELTAKAWNDAVERGEPYLIEHRIRQKGQSEEEYRWVLSRGVPVKNEEGEVVKWYGTATDIDASKRAEEALRRNRETFVKLVQDSPFGIYAVDADFRLFLVSQGAQKVFKNVRPLLGRKFEEVLRTIWSEPFATEAIDIFRNTLETGVSHHSPSTVQRRGDIDAVESYDWKTERISMPDGRFGVVCHFYDLSERQEYEASLRESEEKLRLANNSLEQRVWERTQELEKANREMEGFTYSIAHDLRAPLRAIVSTSRMLIEDIGGQLDSVARHHLDRQAYNAAKLASLIDDLLTLARVSRQQPARRRVDVSRLATDLGAQCVNGSHRVEVQPSLVSNADPSLLRIVLENLLDNASKYSPRGGTIRVGSCRRDGVEALFVADEGIGFDMKYAERIFLPFERLHRDGEFPGTGIGLANVKRIIERHGGRVWAESPGPERGATFFFTLG
ncbi:MAG TPA: PAS domain-containing protein [Fimbriimonas sp.]